MMEYAKGQRVRHPVMDQWGVGQVLADTTGETVEVFFEHAGKKVISLKHVQPEKLFGIAAECSALDGVSNAKDTNAEQKSSCKNCGQKTQFGERADYERVNLGWCIPCFNTRENHRFKDKKTGKLRYSDSVPTIDGPKGWFKPK